MKTFLVIPTVRDLSFLSQWGNEFAGCELIIVEDRPHKDIRVPGKGFQSVYHYDWSDIRRDFGKDEWIFSRRNAGIRSYGFWKAYQKGADIIVTLDDDCYPVDKNFIKQHQNNLQSFAPEGWFATFPHPKHMFTRGFPYANRNKLKVVVSHGLWSNKIDMDAKTQLQIGDVNIAPYPAIRQFVPGGHYFPMSTMNLAFTREAVPLMYLPLMGRDPADTPWGYDRFDDIWAGVFAKKILDHLGLAVVNGSPFVEHRKASDAHKNLIKERTGMKINETLWKAVERVALTKNSPVACYREFSQKIVFPKKVYFSKLRVAMTAWSSLF